jgi:60 kDa SS-A/Ro ribonucleoprotein
MPLFMTCLCPLRKSVPLQSCYHAYLLHFPGWGRGWRRVVTDWYLRKEPMELSECVTKFRGQYGWTHRDIIKLSHPKSANVGNDGLCYEIVFCVL